jgi:hypothetical protein
MPPASSRSRRWVISTNSADNCSPTGSVPGCAG